MHDDWTVTEPMPISDIFATRVRVDVHADFVRLVFAAEHPEGERHVVAKIVMTRAAFEDALSSALRKTGRHLDG